MPLYNPASSVSSPLPGILSEVQYAIDEANSSTTSTTYQTKLTLTTSSLIGGDYALWWYIRNSTSAANKDFQLQILDGSTQIAYYQARYALASSEQPFSGVYIMSNISENTIKTFYMQYARIAANTTLTVNSARFIFFRLK